MKGIQAKEIARTGALSRSEFTELRAGGLGGSDASSILGLNKYRSIEDLFFEKINGSTDDACNDEAENKYIYWGHRLEPIVAEEAQKYLPDLNVEVYDALLQSKKYPWMRANLDRVVLSRGKCVGLLECKTTGYSNNKQWAEGTAPPGYIAQVEHYMGVTGLQSAYLACLIGGQRFVLKEVIRDDALIDNMIWAEEDFWRHKEQGIMPTGLSDEGLMAKAIIEAGGLIEEIFDDNNR